MPRYIAKYKKEIIWEGVAEDDDQAREFASDNLSVIEMEDKK